MSNSKPGDLKQANGKNLTDEAKIASGDPTGSPVSLRIIFAVLFFGCTGYLLFSEILLTLLRMMDINH